MKIRPFEQWIKQFISAGQRVVSYVAIRADEDHREGYAPTNPLVTTKMPLRERGIDKEGVIRLLEDSGIGLPAYYDWRSRSGCTFCFYQQKIEWVRLMREHPDAFEDAKRYEKTALAHGSPFTWSQGESLEELEKPERIEEIEKDYEERLRRARARRTRNPLWNLDESLDVDDVYGLEEGGGACLVCHK